MGNAEIPPDVGTVKPFPGFRDKGFRGKKNEVLLLPFVRKRRFDTTFVQLAEGIVKKDRKGQKNYSGQV